MILDLLETRFWADDRHRWTKTADDLVSTVRTPFETLAAIRYDAPWKAGRR